MCVFAELTVCMPVTQTFIKINITIIEECSLMPLLTSSPLL